MKNSDAASADIETECSLLREWLSLGNASVNLYIFLYHSDTPKYCRRLL